MTVIDPNNFQEEVILKSYLQPVLVDFWAPWCKPCLQLIDTMGKVISRWENEFHFGKMDVDEHTDLALDWKIRGVPNVKIWINGYVLREFSTALTEVELNHFLQLTIEDIQLLNVYKKKVSSKPNLSTFESILDPNNINLTYLLHLTRWYLLYDLDKAMSYLTLMSKEEEVYSAFLYLKDLSSLLMVQYSNEAVGRKLWAAKNALQKQDFEAAFQFLLQAHQLGDNDAQQTSAQYILALNQYLGDGHRVTVLYKDQSEAILL